MTCLKKRACARTPGPSALIVDDVGEAAHAVEDDDEDEDEDDSVDLRQGNVVIDDA